MACGTTAVGDLGTADGRHLSAVGPRRTARRHRQARHADTRLEAYDVVILDTAGRLHIDTELMTEASQVRDAAEPLETLVADAMTGQDSVNRTRVQRKNRHYRHRLDPGRW